MFDGRSTLKSKCHSNPLSPLFNVDGWGISLINIEEGGEGFVAIVLQIKISRNQYLLHASLQALTINTFYNVHLKIPIAYYDFNVRPRYWCYFISPPYSCMQLHRMNVLPPDLHRLNRNQVTHVTYNKL
jgi:hypothetical protein